MAALRENTNSEEFVTIVSVGNSFAENGVCDKVNNIPKATAGDVPFVTVLSIGQTAVEEDVTVYRLPGEKLGFGLKFEGGTKSAERVRRLFIQSCAAESPAGRARAGWGPLDAGDEILCIDGISVTSLTRLECVRCLKDSNVAVKLLVRHSPEGKHLVFDGNCPMKNGIDSDHNNAEIERLSLPPPVPPRKLPRRNTKDSLNCELNGNGRVVSTFEVNQSGNDCKKNDNQYKMSDSSTMLENGQGRKGPLGRQSPGRPRRPAPIHSAPPPEAQVYTDLFCHEKENGIHIAESESDDTGSSISTVIDRLSSYSSFPGSVENSIPSTPTLGTKQINIHVLTSIENMDEKFISDIPTRYIDDISNKDSPKSNVKLNCDKNTTGDVQIPNGDVHANSNEVVISNISITKEFTSVKLDHSAKYINDANNNTNTIKIGNEDVVDFVPNKVTAVTEIPKPLPRNLNKKNVDSHLHNDYNNKMDRPYEENLSPAKLHNIETWLQDAINMNNFENVKDHHEYDREMIKPEALPRLIDFVPKSQFGPKNQVEVINQQKEPPVASERKEKPEFNLKLTINIDKEHEILKADDLSSDWTYTGGSSPQLETIGEDDEDSPGGPTLPIIKVTQQPSIGLTNGDGSSTPEAAKSTSSDDTIFNDTPPISNKYDMPVLEKASSKTIEPEECAVNLVVSRGTRSPPDGRENPATHQENVPIFSNITNKLQDYASQKSSCPPNTKSTTNYLLKETMVESSPRILYEPSQKNNKIMPSKTYGGRGKDVKSEGSVKDKIAMFSVHKTVPDNSSDKKSPMMCKSTEPRMSQRFSAYNDSLSKSHESLLDSSNYYSGKSVKTQKPIADWSVNGVPNKTQEPVNGVSNKNHDFVLAKPYNNTSYEIKSLNSVEKPKEIKPAPITMRNVQPISAIDSKKIDKAKTDSHKSTIDYLIEQRRKSMTKLRGLVIPDSPCISDLPEIKSRDSLKTLTSPIIDKTSTLDRYTNKSKPSKPTTFLPSLWDSQSLANNVPKYSPAFKRKPLQVYGTKTTNESTLTKPMNGFNGENKGGTFSASATEKSTIPSKPPRTTLDTRRPYEQHDFSKKTSTLPSNFRGPASVANPPNYGSTPSQLSKPKRHELFSVIDTVDHSNLKILKAFSDAADSDNDSAVSSTQSSYLSTVSSPTPSLNTADNSESDCSSQSTLSRDVIAASKLAMGKTVNGHDERPFENGLNRSYLQMDDRKRNVCRSLSSDTSTSVGSSNSSTLTSGSQASCSSAGSSNPDTGSHRILKPRSIEAINRKNILASAKCRSGKDNKFGSPLIERKFSDAESTDECDANKDSKHMSNGSMVRYHSIKNASAYTGDAVLKIAYSTLVVDEKCSSLKKPGVDCTCSTTDTGSESEAEVTMPVKVETKPSKPKKYTNGPTAVQQDRIAPMDTYTEQSRARKRVPAAKPGPVVEVGTRPTADGVESPKTTTATTVAKVKGSLMQEEDNEQCSEVRLSRGEGGGVGVTLAGGADCEAKEVTIHKVLQGSAAERDGRLCKGDKVVSINGQPMKGLTHAQSVAILKDPQPEVIIVIRGKRPAADVSKSSSNSVNMSCDTTISVELEKADAPGGAGLGISLEGGGNKPILINKLFTGGAAARSGQIKSGSELLAAGGTKLVGLTRTEAWGLLRALPSGPVTLLLRPP